MNLTFAAERILFHISRIADSMERLVEIAEARGSDD